MSAAQIPELRYEGLYCTLAIQKPAASVIVLRISGSDVGEFGLDPIAALDSWLAGSDSFHLFIDAHEGRGVSINVSAEWAHWLDKSKGKLLSVTMLTGSPLIRVTAGFVRRFAALEGSMRICNDAQVFQHALSEAIASSL